MAELHLYRINFAFLRASWFCMSICVVAFSCFVAGVVPINLHKFAITRRIPATEMSLRYGFHLKFHFVIDLSFDIFEKSKKDAIFCLHIAQISI